MGVKLKLNKMKNLLLITITLLLFSCDNPSLVPIHENHKIEKDVIELANADTTCNKIVVADKYTYIVRNNEIKEYIYNDNQSDEAFLFGIIIGVVLMGFIWGISN